MLGVTIPSLFLLLTTQEATGVGSGPHGPGAPADMPVASGADAPGTPGSGSRNPAVYRRVTAAQADAYRTRVAGAHSEAQAMAAAARSGQAVGASNESIRSALQSDMEGWRDTFHIAKTEWRATTDQWLPPLASLTPGQWAERRAQWFASREEWLRLKLSPRGK